MTKIGVLDTESVLPAHEAVIGGRVEYFTNKNGWADDWLTNIHKGDTVAWDVEAVHSGSYTVALQYVLGEGDVELSVGDAPMVELPIFKSEMLPNYDRVQRGTAYEQTWGYRELGTVNLTKGMHTIALNFAKDGLQENLGIKAIIIKKN